MKLLLLFMGFWTFFSCQSNKRFIPVAEHKKAEIESGGRIRKFIYFAPKNTEKSLPLIFLLHGGGGSGEGMLYLSRFSDLAEDNGYIVVYPDGTQGRWNDGRNLPFSAADREKVDDTAFFRDLTNYFQSNYRVDRSRIFVAGISNGGLMTQKLLCEASDIFNSGYVVASTTSTVIRDNCLLNQPVSIGFIMGKNDDVIPYKGGTIRIPTDPTKPNQRVDAGNVLSYQESLQFWSEKLECKNKSEILKPKMGAYFSKSLPYTKYVNCLKEVRVEGFVIPRGGHIWPHGFYYTNEKNYGYLSEDLDTREVLLDFFLSSKPKEQENKIVHFRD